MRTLFIVLFGTVLIAQEKATLTVPIVATVVEYEIVGVQITKFPEWVLHITARDNRGAVIQDRHRGVVSATNPTGANELIIALNKANLSTQSLERRLLMHLVAEGHIPTATVTGTPQ
jgi:hypothetical protein